MNYTFIINSAYLFHIHDDVNSRTDSNRKDCDSNLLKAENIFLLYFYVRTN